MTVLEGGRTRYRLPRQATFLVLWLAVVGAVTVLAGIVLALVDVARALA